MPGQTSFVGKHGTNHTAAAATLTYAALQACAGAVAAWLRAHGVAPDRVVALQLHRSLEQVVGVLGVLRSGVDADLVVWNLPHEDALVQPWGVPRAQLVMREGQRLITGLNAS